MHIHQNFGNFLPLLQKYCKNTKTKAIFISLYSYILIFFIHLDSHSFIFVFFYIHINQYLNISKEM